MTFSQRKKIFEDDTIEVEVVHGITVISIFNEGKYVASYELILSPEDSELEEVKPIG